MSQKHSQPPPQHWCCSKNICLSSRCGSVWVTLFVLCTVHDITKECTRARPFFVCFLPLDLWHILTYYDVFFSIWRCKLSLVFLSDQTIADEPWMTTTPIVVFQAMNEIWVFSGSAATHVPKECRQSEQLLCQSLGQQFTANWFRMVVSA